MSVRDEDQDQDPMIGYRDGEQVAIPSSYGDYSGYYESSKYEYDPSFRIDERRMLSPGAENVSPSAYAGSYATPYPGMNNGSICWQGSPAYMLHASFASMPSQSNGASNGEGIGKTGKSKRRRVPTVAQRRAANIRERRRMFNLNESFDVLRKRVPTFAYEKRLSRIETLRLAMIYIAFMADIVEGKEPKDIKLHANRSWESMKKIDFQLADDNDISS